jgi:Sulfate permease and related transporters (MFS superfamily)
VIVLRAVVNIMHLDDFKRLFASQWQDGLIAVTTFAATFIFAPHLDYGLAIGVVLSMALYFYRSMHPRISSLSNGPGNMLRDVKVFKLAECRHIAVIHFQGPLFFGNSGVLEEYILKLLAEKKDLRHIHLVCSGITSIDTSGEDSLEMVLEQAHKFGVECSFSGVVGDVAAMFETSGMLHLVGMENVFLTPREAVCAIYARMKHSFDCEDCPFSKLYCRKREIAQGYTSYYPLSEKMFATGYEGEEAWLEQEKNKKFK